MQHVTTTLVRHRTDEASGQAQLVRDTLRFLLGWVAAVFVLAVGSPVLPPLVPLGIVGLGLLVTTYFFWESLTRLHTRIEGVLSTLSGSDMEPDSPAPTRERRERIEVTHLLSDRYGLAVQTEDFVVPLFPTRLNRPIQSLQLRTLTGASIIAIYRDPEQVIVPQADTVLLPGDVLVLLGERDQLEAAMTLLTELASKKPDATKTLPQIASVDIAEDSPFASHTLLELGLREELEVLIVGVQRGAEHISNPGPDFCVQPGDVLYLWGVPERIEKACDRARARADN
jgi:K+/H+ antiporter YhaU regulatory subunit KhtT